MQRATHLQRLIFIPHRRENQETTAFEVIKNPDTCINKGITNVNPAKHHRVSIHLRSRHNDWHNTIHCATFSHITGTLSRTKSVGLKFSKSRTTSRVMYSCHHKLSRISFTIFVHSCVSLSFTHYKPSHRVYINRRQQ